MNPLKNKPNINVSLINNSPINCLENYRELHYTMAWCFLVAFDI